MMYILTITVLTVTLMEKFDDMQDRVNIPREYVVEMFNEYRALKSALSLPLLLMFVIQPTNITIELYAVIATLTYCKAIPQVLTQILVRLAVLGSALLLTYYTMILDNCYQSFRRFCMNLR